MKSKIKQRVIGAIVTILLIMTGTIVCAGEIVIITNAGVPIDSMDRSIISDIYQGLKTKWDNGDKVIVVMLRKGDTHQRFATEIAGSTPSKLRNIWKKVIFSGTGNPPNIMKNEAEVVSRVAETSGAIGYIDASTPHKGVKVIKLK